MDCKYRKKEEVDKIMKMKQTFALLCAGAMVITGSAFPVNVQASADWVWNEEVSESGYKKVPYTELTTTADTEADNESSTGEGAHRRNGTCSQCDRRSDYVLLSFVL